MNKIDNEAVDHYSKSITTEFLMILVLFFIIGISFIGLLMIDDKYQYLAKFGSKLGQMILKF